jgi:hypothetical protein
MPTRIFPLRIWLTSGSQEVGWFSGMAYYTQALTKPTDFFRRLAEIFSAQRALGLSLFRL